MSDADGCRNTHPKAGRAAELNTEHTNLNVKFEHTLALADGIWDLPLIGNERLHVENRRRALTDGAPPLSLPTDVAAYVTRQPDGTWFRLCEAEHGEGVRHWSPGNLPDDVEIGTSKEDLDVLIANHSTSGDQNRQTGTPTAPADVNAFEASYGLADDDLDTAEGRRRAVDDFLAQCNSIGPDVIKRSHFWKAAGYRSPRTFQHWQAKNAKATVACDKNVRHTLGMSPADFLKLLSRKGLIKTD